MQYFGEDIKMPALAINRNNMVFGLSQYKEYFEKSFT